MSENKCCGTCQHHVWDKGPEFMCICTESDAEGEYTMYNETCECWEERERT